MPTEALLTTFCNMLDFGTIPQVMKGAFGDCNPARPRNTLSYREKLAEDSILAPDALPELYLLSQSHSEFSTKMR